MSCSLPETLTPANATLTPEVKNLFQDPVALWGKLLPTIRTLTTFDLQKDVFLFGRDTKCDVIVSDQTIPKRRLESCSRLQFRIEQSAEGLVYITDLSKNGTFLNGKLIGRTKQCILQNGDEISIAIRKLRVYKFIKIQNSNYDYLPNGLKRKYEVSTMLGQGACGEVRLVFDKYTCKPYACKKIVKSTGSSRKFNRSENIKKEVEILKQLNHPFVISIREVEETPSAYYIIMEYMEGGELSHLIESPRRLTEPQVKFLFFQIATAVQYLHSKDITHRDLKPANILLINNNKDDNMVKITDFGLSKMNQQSMMETVCGTPLYVAPEVLDSSASTYGKKVDVWSMGIILYYMLAQKLPFKAPTTVKLVKAILAGRYSMNDPLWSELSKSAKDLVSKMLVRNPKERINVDQVIDHPWFAEDIPLQRKIQDLLDSNFATRMLDTDSDEFKEDEIHKSKRIKLSLSDDWVETEIH